MIKKINKCRLCNNKNLNSVISFGKVPLGNNFQDKLSKSLKASSYNLSLNRCKNCGHFQLGYLVDKKILYATNYTYLSGVTKTFLIHFENYVKKIIKKTNLKPKSFVVDIGSNDGSCLKYFKKNKMKVLGIDPATKPANIANVNRIETINQFFNKRNALLIKKKYGQADFITSHNVFAHVEDFQKLISNTLLILKNNGFLCFEVGYFQDVLKNNYFDTIYHEHLDYHHALPLVKCLNSFGYSVVEITTNKIQGGSLRILCKNDQKSLNSLNVNRFTAKEEKSIYFRERYLANWKLKILKDMNKITKFIGKNIQAKKRLIGYGAPTKASLIMKILKIDKRKLKLVIEDNHLKINKFLPVTGIPILSRDFLISSKPDIILIFAWNFKKEILKSLKKIIKKRIVVIIPLPKLEIYNL